MHRKLINVHTNASLSEDDTTVTGPFDIKGVSLITEPPTSLDVIPYLDDSLKKTKALIDSIIASEPLLRI
jgi:hypothetical protein